ncbi:hypothetical protein GOV12_03615 [Candidatus Pacearchaeota archaeon]|nr:hypothetical protein [Candidatus Pacearchaeota archaeon]
MTNKELIKDITKGVIPAIWISLGLAALLCGFFCITGAISGMEMFPGMDLNKCGIGCVVFGLILIVLGYVWYKRVTR